jgi:hypothetical protein
MQPQRAFKNLSLVLVWAFKFVLVLSDDSREGKEEEVQYISVLLKPMKLPVGSAALWSAGFFSIISFWMMWFCKRTSKSRVANEAENIIAAGEDNNLQDRKPQGRLGIKNLISDNSQWVDMKGDTYIPEIDIGFNSEEKTQQQVRSLRFKALEQMGSIDEES